MARRLASWMDGFLQYTDKLGSPSIFRKWTGIFTLAAALERKVHITTNKGDLFPNLYVIIVGPPAAGKTLAASIAYEMLLHLEEHHIAPTSVTRASLIDALAEAERKIVRPMDNPPVHSFHSLSILSNELGVLIPGYENDFMNVLTDIYDNRIYSESRRTMKIKIKLDRPQLNILAATTPSYLNNLLPEGAWDQGFLSRVMLSYSGAMAPTDIFEEHPLDKVLYSALVEDLKHIGDLWGKMRFTPEAAQIISKWHTSSPFGGEPVPEHPKLTNYNGRRTSHLLKLCMIASISTSDDLLITIDHFAEALDWLTEAEAFMPDIFKSMSVGGDSRVMDETWYHAYTLWVKEKKPIAEHRLTAFVAERTPAHNVQRILEVMTKATILTAKHVAGVGMCYEPRPRR